MFNNLNDEVDNMKIPAKLIKGVLKAVGGTVGAMLTITSIYGLDFYRAEDHLVYAKGVRIKRGFGFMEYGDPENCDSVFMFYPGGKVGLNAYGELLSRIAKENIFVVVCGMPVNLAVLNPNSADKYVKKYKEKYPNLEHWYIGGHSLGGTIANKHAIKRPGVYEGVVFLASFPDKNDDMNMTDMKSLSIYGSIDSVINRETYKSNYKNFKDLKEVVIEGGNHGNFGTYGFQNSDHTSLIDRLEQIDTAATEIVKFIKG